MKCGFKPLTSDTWPDFERVMGCGQGGNGSGCAPGGDFRAPPSKDWIGRTAKATSGTSSTKGNLLALSRSSTAHPMGGVPWRLSQRISAFCVLRSSRRPVKNEIGSFRAFRPCWPSSSRLHGFPMQSNLQRSTPRDPWRRALGMRLRPAE